MRSCPIKWFKHDTDASIDAKLQELLLDYGASGYGLYWYCIELIAQGVDQDNITFELEHDARIIARNLNLTHQETKDMMTKMIDLGLFSVSSNQKLACYALAKRLDKSMTSNVQFRNLIEEMKKNHDFLEDNHDSVMTHHDLVMPEEKRRDKKRKEENREEEKPKPQKRFVPPTKNEVATYMQSKGLSSPIAELESEKFINHYEANGWRVGKNKMKNWRAAASGWLNRMESYNATQNKPLTASDIEGAW